MSTWKWELSQRDWENESTSTKWPWLMSSWIKCGLSQMRPDCSFTSSRLRAGPPGCRSCLATWRGESEMDSARDQSSSSDFRLCCGNRALRCDGVWTPTILRCWLTSDPGERGRRYEKKKTVTFLVSTAEIGSVIGALLHPGPGYLSSAEKRLVTVMYGCCNPSMESPDVYPTPCFLLLLPPQRTVTGNPKPYRRLAVARRKEMEKRKRRKKRIRSLKV